MSVITLLTDFGLEDNFVGVMKGVILGINPSARIVDITHTVEPHDVFGAGFLLKGAYRFFPKGTIHLVIVDPGVGSQRKAIIAKTKDYYFVGPDNGVLSLALEGQRVERVIDITNKKYFLKPASDTFHGRDIFAPVCAYLSKGIPVERFGKEIGEYKKLTIPVPKEDRGEVIYIDRFGNLVTNINNRRIKLVKFKGVKIGVVRSYSEVEVGKPLAVFGSFGYLEIGVNQGSAKDYFKAKIGDEVRFG